VDCSNIMVNSDAIALGVRTARCFTSGRNVLKESIRMEANELAYAGRR